MWAIMLRTINAEPTLWDAILPEVCLRLPPRLAAVDSMLDDPRFFEPFVPFFSARHGRPSIPMETYIRMMFLRFRYQLGFETLCAEVADSIAWRRFCRIPLDTTVPHPTTLLKITARCGPAAIDALNEALLAKASEAKLVRTDRVRADTTVVEANVAYPTDSGLLAKGVATLVRSGHGPEGGRAGQADTVSGPAPLGCAAGLMTWPCAYGGATMTPRREVLAITGTLADLAEATVEDARAVAVNARRALARRGAPATGRTTAALADIDRVAGLVEAVIAQTRQRIAGDIPDGSTRVVSLHDPDARPIRKGRLGRPVEFGYKAQVADNVDGVVVDHSVVIGNPPDAPMLAPAIARIKNRFGRAPAAVTADRGYGEAAVDQALTDGGVTTVAIPRRGKPSAERVTTQRGKGFIKLVKWRTGSEARISCLKRDYLWNRTLFDSLTGARTWCGWGVLAHNTAHIAVLADQADARDRQRAARRQPGTDPPTPDTPHPSAA